MTDERSESANVDLERAAQNNQLRDQLIALDAGPKERLDAFTSFTARCGGCGDTVFSVIETKPYRTLRYRRPGDALTSSEQAEGETQAERQINWRKSSGSRNIRANERMFVALPDREDSGTAIESILGFCRCSRHQWSMSALMTELRRKTPQVTLPVHIE
ncbi:hypothetical protein [Allobranchiibius sp. GilTou73]|uniref:hypothetical protein n=1 Tax=Allobranchiibius sp. GilTou73 TaxID=2904523 RepID=UPI001F42C231|nr:hypothetical protein [Allobranchiibius sp. GilTou73]UIJ34504.1 hypothetical protein LVQ62_15545 [Allobranchiibius sp. GilTou73]